MARRPPAPRKRRTCEHVIADLSINHIERQALLCGYAVERWVHDYGIDLVLLTYADDGAAESGNVLIQAKATDRLRVVGSGKFVSFRIERADLRAWLTEPMPVILIVYDAPNDPAYWLYVQAAFAGSRRFQVARRTDRLTVQIPISQALAPGAIRCFRGFRDAVLAQNKGVIHRE